MTDGNDLDFFRAAMPESSALATGADDALKDLDNTWFLRGQPKDVRRAWFDRIRILRLVDRLAEAERAEPEEYRFTEYVLRWRHLLETGRAIGPDMREAKRLWVDAQAKCQSHEAKSFHDYMSAIEMYSVRGEEVADVWECTTMLRFVSGSMFQLFPYVADEDWEYIRSFGALDGFWNNLRDLAEDSAAGLCYFPTDVLERHGLTRDDVLTGRCIGTDGWNAMMRFWLDEYMPTLLERAQPFIDATGLHPSLEALRGWCMHRWRRVEIVFREVDYDYRAFDVSYWDVVRRELTERSEAA